jgi:glycosidase
MCDPANPDSVNNNMGGYNSLLKVGKYRQAELPFIRTARFTSRKIYLECNSELEQVYTFWQNQETEFTSDGHSIAVDIPQSAKRMDRSFIRVIGYNSSGISNDLLIPLEKGRVVTDPAKLTRFDRQTMILYFMMIDRFRDGNPANDHPVNDPEILPKANYFGGDLQGIDQTIKDGYFKNLGVNTLWLSPITQNPETAYGLYLNPRTRFSGYHGYWPVFLTKIDHRYGTSDDLHKLIDDAHSDNMNVLLDYVAHHVHELSPVYRQHPEWTTSLYLPDGSLNTEKWDEYRLTTWFDTFLPTLDLRRPEVVDPMTDSALIWIEQYGFDGFRHDATKHIDELFWRTLTSKLKAVTHCNPMVYQIGETYGSPELIGSYIGSGMLDAQFDFNVYDDEVAVFARPDESFERLKNSLDQSLRYYGYHNLMGYITGNQDRPRFISLAGGDLKFTEDSKYAGWTRNIGVGDSSAYQKLMMLHAFNLTIPGIPVIYYGDEIGLPGANDPDNRRWMKFEDLTIPEKNVKQVVTTLTHLRMTHMPLLYGDLQFISANERELIYIRRYFNDFVLVIFNKANESITIEISDPIFKNKDLITVFGSGIVQNRDQLSLEIPPMNFEIVVPE